MYCDRWGINTPSTRKFQMLLSREEFRNKVFNRDNHRCVFCNNQAVDAHHIIERRLFKQSHERGGYFLDNGASVCEFHHLECEKTNISVEQVLHACRIDKPKLPEHLYQDQPYDKWGNPVLLNGTRLKGELFDDISVQKILKQSINWDLFVHYVKYPRTYHLPWSENRTPDDRTLPHMENFTNNEVVVTIKMDGESTSMYRDHIHARSLDSRNHPSRNWVKGFWSKISHDIPEGWRICGENLYAVHSIKYTNLPSYFLGFSIWNEQNICLDWNTTLEWFELLGIIPVQELYRGPYCEKTIRQLWNPGKSIDQEGYVVRNQQSFHYQYFNQNVGKFVRKDHIPIHGRNWQSSAIEINSLKL